MPVGIASQPDGALRTLATLQGFGILMKVKFGDLWSTPPRQVHSRRCNVCAYTDRLLRGKNNFKYPPPDEPQYRRMLSENKHIPSKACECD